MTAKIIWTLIFFCSIRGVYANAAKKEIPCIWYYVETALDIWPGAVRNSQLFKFRDPTVLSK